MRKNDILALILPEVAGCPSATAWVAVLRAAQELCRASGVWREWLDEILLLDGIAEYELEPSDGGVIDMVKEIWVGTRELHGKSHSEINWLMPDWRTSRSTEPVYFNVDGPRNTVTVYPTPASPIGSLRVRVQLVPSLSATSIPDDVYTFYGEAIEKGAKGKLMMQRGTQWYEPKLGAVFADEFNIAVNDARIEEMAGQVPSSTRVQPRLFGS